MRPNNALTRAPVLNLSKPRDKRMLMVIQRDELIASWQQQAFAALDEMELRQREGTLTPRDGKDLAIKGGICTEKALLAAGEPTATITNLHLHRHEISDVVDKLARALGRAAIGGPVLHSPSFTPKPIVNVGNASSTDAACST